MITLERALLLVRDLDGDGGPECPVGWACIAQDGRWYEIEAPSGARVLAYRENDNGAQGLFALVGDAATLALIDGSSALALPAREAWRRRLDPAVLPYMRRWRTFRWAGLARDSGGTAQPFAGVSRLIPDGAVLPDPSLTPLPWYLAEDGSVALPAAAAIRVDSITRPALAATMAGLNCQGRFEAEPDPGGP